MTIEAFNSTLQLHIKITEKEYEVALKRITKLLQLVTNDTLNDDCALIELLKVSDIAEKYEYEHYPNPGWTTIQ